MNRIVHMVSHDGGVLLLDSQCVWITHITYHDVGVITRKWPTHEDAVAHLQVAAQDPAVVSWDTSLDDLF